MHIAGSSATGPLSGVFLDERLGTKALKGKRRTKP